MINKFVKEAVWSILVFFGILAAIGYFNDGYVGMKRMLSDPINWIVVIVVIAASIMIKLRRRRKRQDEEPGN
ncbi:MAG: hypothetical protein R3281_03915 [Balneolaceae bacterium]|nr:hypothetical protein [Balneolaceae bacterium]